MGKICSTQLKIAPLTAGQLDMGKQVYTREAGHLKSSYKCANIGKDDGLNGPPIQKMGPPEGQKHHHITSFVCGDGGNYDVEYCACFAGKV